MQCSNCKEVPGFHSFEHIADVSGIHYFYCFPAQNKESVRTRDDMLNFVSHFPQTGKWSLLFHVNGYGPSHMMPLSLALEMGKLVQENHLDRLQKIYVIQGSWFMNFLILCILPFLRKEMKEKFVVLPGSVLDIAGSFQKEGVTLKHLERLRANFG
jgi:hypothetical protein